LDQLLELIAGFGGAKNGCFEFFDLEDLLPDFVSEIL